MRLRRLTVNPSKVSLIKMWRLVNWMAPALLLLLAMPARAGTYPINYHLTRGGNVSLVVYNSTGAMTRELLRAVPQSAGDHTVIWDGLDRDGNPQGAGKYTWKLLQTPGLTSHFLMNVGTNYPPGDDIFSSGGPGSHLAPYTVACDKTGVYISAATTENIETCALKLSPDGTQRLWSLRLPATLSMDGALSIAVDGGKMYLLGCVNPQTLYVTDSATGAPGKNIDVRWDAGRDVDATDMDIGSGVLVVAYAAKNTIRWYNPATGQIIDSATISSPQGVTVGEDGTVFVSSGTKVVSLTQSNHVLREVVTGLTNPGRVDFDNSNGTLLVYDAGSAQIKRFSTAGPLPANAPTKTYGAAGGRQDGLYVAANFAGFTDLCADGTGGFFEAEAYAAPRRTAHFAGDGTLIREWYGGQRWAPAIACEPGDNTHLWVTSNGVDPDIMRITVDYAKKTWSVHSCYRYARLAGGKVGDIWNSTGQIFIYQHAGIKYLVLQKYPTILKIDSINHKLIPVTLMSGTTQWNDSNGNGLQDDGETATYPNSLHAAFQPFIDADFNFCYADDSVTPHTLRILPVVSWNNQGAPVYAAPPGLNVGTMPLRYRNDLHNDVRFAGFLYRDAVSGELYGALNPGDAGWSKSFDSFMQKWSSDGKPRWNVGEQGSYNGQIRNNLRSIAGTTKVATNLGSNRCVIATDYDGGWWHTPSLAQTYVWDEDGLFVGGVMDSIDTASPRFLYKCGGEFCHSAVFTDASNNVFFYGNWENCVRVYQVTGWTKWHRARGTFTITAPSPPSVGQGLTARYFDNADFTDLRTTRADGPIDFNWGTAKPDGTALTSADDYSVRWSGTLVPTYGPRYPGWDQSVMFTASAYGGAAHYTNATRLGMDFKFNGTSITILGLKGPGCGNAAFSVDGEKPQVEDCYSATTTWQVPLYKRIGLAPGDHTVTVLNMGRHQVSSLYIDAFIVDDVTYDDDGLPYVLYADSDDGSQLNWIADPFLLNSPLVLSDWYAKGAASEKATAPIQMMRQHNPIQLSYFKGKGGNGRISLSWSGPWTPKSPIPAEQMYPQIMTCEVTEELAEGGSIYAGSDINSQGSWIGKYGNDGYHIIGNSYRYPEYVTVTLPAQKTIVTQTNSTDPRALQQASDGGQRIDACWYGNPDPSRFTLDLNFTDGKWHKFSIYTVDMRSEGYTFKFQVTDGDTGKVLDTRAIYPFRNGRYLSWNLKGHKKVSCFCAGGPRTQCFISGFFFDPPEGEIPAIRNGWLEISGGKENLFIPDGTNTTDIANGTDFGAVNLGSKASRTFALTQRNDGAVSGTGNVAVKISGPQAPDFKVTTHAGASLGQGGGTFTVKFTPSAKGLRKARIRIVSDSDDAPYDFAIQGTGTPSTRSKPLLRR